MVRRAIVRIEQGRDLVPEMRRHVQSQRPRLGPPARRRLARVSQLAQVNVARLRAPLDDPIMKDFVAAVTRVHHLAETSPGFVWRLNTEHGHGLCVTADDGAAAFLNLSVWQDYEQLHAFTYRSAHGQFVRHRSRWFEPTRSPSTALWWVPSGAPPTAAEAARRLAYLRAHGPSPRAFSLRRRFTPSGEREPMASRTTRLPRRTAY